MWSKVVTRFVLKGVIAAAALGYCLAVIFFAVSAPASSATHNAISQNLVSVDRTNKGDRLPPGATSTVNMNRQSPGGLPKRRPLGCEAMFSSMANPSQAQLYRRCLA